MIVKCVLNKLFLLSVFVVNVFCQNFVFISTSNYLSKDVVTSTSQLSACIKDVFEKNYDGVVFNIRKDGYVVYISSFEKNFVNFDFLKFAYEETKKYGLKFFLHVEMFSANAHFDKKLLAEVTYQYVLSCSNPETQVYLRKVVQELLENYLFDGVIFDFSKNLPCKASYERFYTRGNPLVLEWEDFLRQELNKFVFDLYAIVKLKKPDMFLGCVSKGVFKDSKNLKGDFYENFQDTNLWVDKTICDFVVTYSTDIDPKNRGSFVEMKNYSKSLSSSTKSGNSFSVKPSKFLVYGYIVDEKGSPLTDAWVELKKNNGISNFTLSSFDGFFSFAVEEGSFLINVRYPYAESVCLSVDVSTHSLILISVPNSSTEAEKLFFNILKPKVENIVVKKVNFLCRTLPENSVEFSYDKMSLKPKVFSTGIFVIDNVQLKENEENNLTFKISNSSKTSVHNIKLMISTVSIISPTKELKEQPTYQWLIEETDLLLFTGDILELKIKAPEGKNVYSYCFDNQQKLPLVEISSGIYYLLYRIPENFSSKKTKVKFEITTDLKKKFLFFESHEETFDYFEPEVYVEVWDSIKPLVGKTTVKKTPISYSYTQLRLGGPYAAEVPSDTKLNIVGKQSDKYKIQLNKFLTGWVETKNVVLLREEKTYPENTILSCSINSSTSYDSVTINFSQLLPFSVYPLVENNNNYIVVDFFNAFVATNWIQQNQSPKVVEEIKPVQLEEGLVRVYIKLKSKQNWGVWWSNTSKSLNVNINIPPKINPKMPLSNIKIAIEAGHGGDNNTGATGLAGTKEKNVNLNFVNILKNAFEKENAKVVLMREGDTNPTFDERLSKAYSENANLIISIHSNASSTEAGYLSSSQGISVYYKHDNCKKFAEMIYGSLTKKWNKNYGVISNFNYAIVRQPRVPAMLVELAFLTHPEDEALLLDKKFLKNLADGIVEGTKSFLLSVKE